MSASAVTSSASPRAVTSSTWAEKDRVVTQQQVTPSKVSDVAEYRQDSQTRERFHTGN